MTKKEFKRLFFQGRGKAIQHLKSCPDPMKYADIIAYCCDHNTSYDAQCEGSGAVYLCDAIMLTGEPDYFKKLIMGKCQKPLTDDWEVQRMLEILMNLYFEGHEDVFPFLEELYQREFECLSRQRRRTENNCSGFEFLCLTIAAIDKSYYPKTVHLVGRYLTEHPGSEAFSLDWFCSHVSEHEKLLKKVPPEYVKAFKDAFEWQPNREIPPEKKVVPPDIHELKRRVYAEPFPIRAESACRLFGNRADSEDIAEIMALIKKSFFEEHNEKAAAAFLCTFENSELPPDFDVLEKIFRAGGWVIRSKCLEIMAHHGWKYAEQYALEILEDRENDFFFRENAMCAYIEAAKDYADIIKQLDNFPKEEFIHAVHWAFLDYAERRDKYSRRAKELLMFFYENNPCSCCRLDCIRYMSRCRCLSNEILLECAYDYNTDTRDYARKLLKRRGVLME